MKIKKKIVVFASGSGSSFENICKRFSKDTFVEISKLYCNNNKAFVVERAQKQGIKSLIFQNEDLTNKRILMDLRKVNPDLIVLAGFLKKIPTDIPESLSYSRKLKKLFVVKKSTSFEKGIKKFVTWYKSYYNA